MNAALRPDVVAALFHREWLVFRRVWAAPMFGSIVEPLVYLVAFGFGFGALVSEVAGVPYLDFMATGSAAISVLFTGMFPGLINSYFRRNENHLYDGLIAAPVTPAELVTGEAAWTGVRTTIVTVITLTVAAALGVGLSPTVLLVPVIGYVGGFAFHCLGAGLAAHLRSTHQFDFVIAGMLVPMFVIAGTFFPLDDAPAWIRWPAQVNPLTHITRLFRATAFGTGGALGITLSVLVVVAFTLLVWVFAARSLRRALID